MTCLPLLIPCIISLVSAVSGGSIGGRIAGGQNAAEHGYPYQASLRVRGDHKCGGSLLNRRWILTAAHCVAKYEVSNFIVILGSNSLIYGGFAFCAQEVQLHPSYVLGEQHDDIALLKLCTVVNYGPNVAPVQLPSVDIYDDDCKAVFTGWGSSQKDGSKSFSLKVVELSTINLDRCRGPFPSVNSTNICTFNGAGQGLCYGDAGSPLVVDGVQIGIASWGSPCAQGYPDVFTRVYSYVDWILPIIADEFDS